MSKGRAGQGISPPVQLTIFSAARDGCQGEKGLLLLAGESLAFQRKSVSCDISYLRRSRINKSQPNVAST